MNFQAISYEQSDIQTDLCRLQHSDNPSTKEISLKNHYLLKPGSIKHEDTKTKILLDPLPFNNH